MLFSHSRSCGLSHGLSSVQILQHGNLRLLGLLAITERCRRGILGFMGFGGLTKGQSEAHKRSVQSRSSPAYRVSLCS